MNFVRWSVLAIAASLGTACALIVGVTDLEEAPTTDASTGDARSDAIADGGTPAGDARFDAGPDVGTGRSTCPYAQLSCDGGLVDPLTDKDNCGACGTRCDTGAGQACVVGYCLRPFYIGPNGTDQATNGDAPDASVKTFAYAFAHFDVGQALVLLPGTYSNADGGSGIIDVTCGMSAQSGMSDQPIVVAAQEEREAVI
jgi:Stigma-specific protein, Stig1